MRNPRTLSGRVPNTISTVSHRRLSHRLCMLVLLLAVLPALLLSLAGCGGGGAAAEATPPSTDGRAQALQASASGELLSYVKDKIRQRASTLASDPAADVNGPSAAPPLTFNASPTATGAATLVSASTIQEPGVDEPDLIKSDGSLILSLQPDARTADAITPRLRSHRRQADGSLVAVSSMTVTALPPANQVSRGLLYAEAVRRAAVLAESITISSQDPCTTGGQCVGGGITGLPFAAVVNSSVEVQLVSADSVGNLVTGDRFSISGRLVGARKIGNTLVVVSTYTPVIAADKLPATTTAAEREAALALLRTQDLLPSLRVNNGTVRALLADTDCWVQPGNASTGIQLTSITTLDLGTAGAQPTSRCIVGGSEALYMSSNTLVLATTRTRYLASNLALTIYPPAFKTDLHKFSFSASGVAYRGSGVVDGHLGFDPQRKAQRISEFNGDVRVLSYTGSAGWGNAPSTTTAPSPATLTVLRERASDTTLQEVARLPNSTRPAAIGKTGEQVYAVRFAADRAYVVTFRRTDPLYVLDLSNAADPRTAGEVEVAGVSENLFPLPNGLLFGVGRDADANGTTTGLKFSLIDVANAASPREIATVVVGNRFSSSGLDYALQGLGSLQVGSTTRLALPVLLFNGSNAVPGTPSQQLQRFEVDSTTRALRSRPAFTSSASAGHGLWTERSLQIDNDLYYLSNGELTRWAW